MPEVYNKQALSFAQQLDQLQARGLQIDDHDQALQALASISYYRLSAYWFPFRRRDKQGRILNDFREGASFFEVLRLYEFDRHLRMLVLDAIERAEVAIRTRITYHMAHTYGAFAHTDPANFHPHFNHADWLAKLEAETLRSSEEFIRHYRNKYQGFPSIPIWMLTEVMSFGGLSFFYKGLQNNQRAGVTDKKAIADYFGLHHRRLGDWLHTLTYVRNVCAHHSRLWNRELAIHPDQSRDPLWLPPQTPRNDRIFYVLLMLRHLLRSFGNGDDWALTVSGLLDSHCANPKHREAMGIPQNWQEHPLWQ